MPPLTLSTVGARTVLLESDGSINAPFSIFLNDEYDNPHSKEAVASGLRLLHRFLEVFGIDLAARALQGDCLSSVECKHLAQLAYRPLPEVEMMSAKMLKRYVTAGKKTEAPDLKGAVEPNTAAKRLMAIISFLQWYLRDLLNKAIRSTAARATLNESYSDVRQILEKKIGKSKQGNSHDIRSLPTKTYLKVIEEVFVNAETLFCGSPSSSSHNLYRDRAIALLAAEGLRPGAIGNLTIDDFRYQAGNSFGYMEIKDNFKRRGVTMTTAVSVAKGTRSTQQKYNSNITVKLWPWTCLALQEYIEGERVAVLGRRLANRSKSFLFLAEHGGPFNDRTSISQIFIRLRKGLKETGLLATSADDPFAKGLHYGFSAYTLRHSAATFFYAAKREMPNVKDLMRERFGWTSKSTSPELYAKRAMSEGASVDLIDFHEKLVKALAAKRAQRPLGSAPQ